MLLVLQQRMPGLQEIGRYRIELPAIASGGMGVVFRAFDSVTRRAVAVKTLKGSPDPESLEMFQKEWSILAGLSHPNIVDILDIGELTEGNERKPYFVMPLLPGKSLDKLVKASGSILNPERAVEIIFQASRGLQAAHDQRVIHRDLKPSNLFVMSDDTVKIIDFGVVRLADSASHTGLKGTLLYMAPELLEFKGATAKSDIFSLGVVCYEALTGRNPFNRRTQEESIEAIRHEMPRPVSELVPAVNEQTSRVVQKALAKQPYHRFSSAKEFGDALRRSLSNEAMELFDRSRIQPRLNRVKRLLGSGDLQLGLEILEELVSEGNIDSEIFLLRTELERAAREKTVQQLLEDARTRIEEEEYPLALQKVQTVLDLEADNIDAQALKTEIERQRGAAQIERWLQIARQHLDNKLFAKARQALEEVSNIDPANAEAHELLAEINRGEEAVAHVRNERKQFFDSARKAYSNGELSSALRLLERVIDLGESTPNHPNTDARYLEFYEHVRREHDELAKTYLDGKNALAADEFEKALDICNLILRRRPREPLFQSLKIEIEDHQRQQNSAAVASLYRQIEAELDLERKFAILADAVKQFPGEQAFLQSFKVVKARRNLVNDIARRARQHEAQGQFIEASNQWETLRTIYKEYSGLEYEIQRLAKKQEESRKNQARARVFEQVDKALVGGDYDEAKDLLTLTLRSEPGDDQLLRLLRQAEEGSEKTRRAQALFQEGQQLLYQGQTLTAIEKLRESFRLEPKKEKTARTLSSVLIEYSRGLAEKDWRSAEPFLREALDIDPKDPAAFGVSQLISDTQRRERIDRCVEETNRLRNEGRLEEAVINVELGLPESLNDTRLLQLRRELLRDLDAVRVAERSANPKAFSAAAGVSSGTTMSGAAVQPALQKPPVSTDSDVAQAGSKSRPTLVRAEEGIEGKVAAQVPSWLLNRRSAVVAAGAGLIVAAAITFGIARTHASSAASAKHSATHTVTAAASIKKDSKSGRSAGNGSDAKNDGPPINVPAVSAPVRPVLTPVKFDSQPLSARVKIDGSETAACDTPCALPLSTGRHTFLASAAGYEESRGVIQVPEDQSKLISLSQDVKQVRVVSQPPNLPISIDGKPAGQTPLTVRLAAGKHNLTFTDSDTADAHVLDISDEDFQHVVITRNGGSSPSTPSSAVKPPGL